jgi:dihydroceramidase
MKWKARPYLANRRQIYVVSYSAYLALDTLPSFKPRFGIWGSLVLILWDIFVTVS